MPPSMGGLVRHYYFKKYLSAKGHNVRILTSSKIHNTQINMIKDNSLYVDKLMDGVTYTYVKAPDYSSNGFDRIKSMLMFAVNVVKLCKKLMAAGERPDVIYASSPEPFSAYKAIKWAKKEKIPTVIEIRDLWPESIVEYNGMSRKNPVIKALYKLEKWLYVNSDRIIFTMEGGRDYIKQKGWHDDVDLNKIYHINNGVCLDEFEKNKQIYIIDDKDLSDESTFKVVYTCSIRKANNLQSIVEAAKICGEKEKRIKFIIYGDGSHLPQLAEYCVAQNLDNIVFKGRIDKKYIPYVLTCSDLTLLNYLPASTWQYGSSQNKLFEYFAAGRPVLSTISVNYSIIKKYCCGMEIENQTPQNIADAVISMSRLNDEEYNMMSANALKAAADYDFKALSDKLEDILIHLNSMY